MSYRATRPDEMAMNGDEWRYIGLTEKGAMEKKRWMPRYFGGSTEIVVSGYEKTVYRDAADDGR